MNLDDLTREELIELARELQGRLDWMEDARSVKRALVLSRFAVDTAREAMFTFEPSGRLVDVNATACQRLGYSRDELVGASIGKFDVRFQSDTWDEVFAKIKQRGSLVIESAHRTRTGRVFPVSISVAYFRLGQEEYMCSFVRDLTQRKQVEAQQSQYQQALREKNALLEAQKAELEEFSYALAHDLKSPLITIKSFSRVVGQDVAEGRTERIQHSLHRIRSAADAMSSLLDEISVLVRAGQPTTAKDWVALQALVHETLRTMSGPIEAAGVAVEVVGELPAVPGSKNRLQRVFQNLIDNSLKYMGDQPQPMIQIGCQPSEHEVVVYVSDNGIGIAPEDQDKIFGLFHQLDESTEGTGLGLAMVKKIIEAHGGRLWVESEGPGQGAKFCFSLPRSGRQKPSVSVRDAS